MENLHLICANNACRPNRIGGDFILIPDEESGQIVCPNCGQQYQFNEQKSTLALFLEEPVVISSLAEYNERALNFVNNNLFIKTLHLKGISDAENFDKIVAYSQCYIENLIIEDVNLQTGCFPFNFDHCYIDNLHIINSHISESGEKDFWGPDAFFGLNFNESSIFGAFILDRFDGDMILRNCELPEKISINNCKLHKLHLLNNNIVPELDVSNSQIADKVVLFDKLKAEEGLLSDVGVRLKKTKKLNITNQETGVIEISNQSIDDLVFSAKETFTNPIQFTNCVINTVEMNSAKFGRSLRFFNCHFISPLTFTKSGFQNTLSLESCFFDEDFVLNECTIGKDLHLSYSSFAANLLINQSDISAYLTMHMANVSGLFSLSYSKVGHNTTLTSNIFNYVKVKSATIAENVFFRNCRIETGCSSVQNQFGGDLSFDLCTLNAVLKINTSTIRADLKISDSVIAGDTTIMLNKIEGDLLFTQSSFLGSTDFTFNRISRLFVYSNRFFQYFMQKDETVSSSYNFNNNICYSNFTFARVKLHDLNLSNTHFLSRLDLDDLDIKDILLTSNKLSSLEITNCECGRFELTKGTVQDLSINDLHARGKFVFQDAIFNGKNYIGGSRFEKFVLIDNSKFFHSNLMLNNRMGSIEISNSNFNCNACLFNNYIETSFTVKNSSFEKVLDMNGSFVTGSAQFLATQFSDVLILDNTFFDKRLDFLQSNPGWVTFTGATFKGFNMPGSWNMKRGRLISNSNGNKAVILDEFMHLSSEIPVEPTFQMYAQKLIEEHEKFQILQSSWQNIKTTVLLDDEIKKLPKELHDALNLFSHYKSLIGISLKNNFATFYYGYVNADEIEALDAACDITVSYLSESNISGPEMKSLAGFCQSFAELSSIFLRPDSDSDQAPKVTQNKSMMYDRLKDQYLNVKEIYGGNGDLGFEDKAYFRWMHYKSLSDLQNSKGIQKAIILLKRLVFEHIFGWGVDLFRIFGSTLLTVLIFSGIYWVSGQLNPNLSILWDETTIPVSMLNYGNILLLTFQTTFAAFMGDWSPAGLGAMKIWMTINAVLGVLLVAFLIGAYGRKMLR